MRRPIVLRSLTNAAVLALAFAFTGAPALLVAAPPPSDRLLPATTKGYVSIPNPELAYQQWNKTQLGRLIDDPTMQPFVEDFRQQWKARLSKSNRRLGLTLDDLREVPGGEVAMALIQPSENEGAQVILVDITGHLDQARRVIDKAAKNLVAQGAKQGQTEIEGHLVTSFDIPKEEGAHRGTRAFHLIKEDALIVCDDPKVLAGILRRWANKPPAGGNAAAPDTLASVAAYQNVNERTRHHAKDLSPHVRWFIEPFGLIEALRAADPHYTPRRGTDMAKLLRENGFSAIQGVGGFVNFSVGSYEMLHRTAVFAPPVEGHAPEERYTKAARILTLPNGGQLAPTAFVPREIATFQVLNIRVASAFEGAGSVVDALARESVFEDIIKDIRDNQDGPMIDIRGEVLSRLADRALIMTDYQLPITPKSERTVIAVGAKDPAGLAKVVNQAMAKDTTAHKREFRGHTIWEIIEQDPDADLRPARVDVPEIGPAKEKDDEEEEKFKIPNSAITVAHGHLLRATHIDFLKKVLEQADGGKPLGESVDFQLVAAEIEKLTAGAENSVRFFSRTDEEFRPTYELIRAGKMPQSETMFGRVLNRLFTNEPSPAKNAAKKKDAKTAKRDKQKEPRKQQIDGHQLPEFDLVRRYLGPAGGFATTTEDGFFITGFTLPKQMPPVEVGMK
jgi:hypothetical protein